MEGFGVGGIWEEDFTFTLTVKRRRAKGAAKNSLLYSQGKTSH